MDSIFSVRISEELKEKFIEIAQKQGINNKELMEHIIKSYELENVKNGAVEAKSHIEELQALSSRIVDIYINLIEGNKIRSLEQTNIFTGRIAEEQEIKNKILTENEELKTKLKEALQQKEELKKQIKVHEEKLSSHDETLQEFKALNKMLKEKNGELAKELDLFKEYESKNKLLQKELTVILKEKDELSKINDKIQHENQQLSSELNFTKDSYEKKISNMEEGFKTSLYQNEQSMKINHSKEVLHLEQEFNEKLSFIRKEYEERISKLLKDKDDEMLRMKNLLLGKE